MAEALRPGKSGTLTPLPEDEPRIRRLRGSSAASSSEDAAGAGRGSVGTQGTVSPRHCARIDTPLPSPLPLGSPVESRKIQLSPSVVVGRRDGARCWRLRPRLALQRNTLLSRSSVSCRAQGMGHSWHGEPRDPPPQPAYPQPPQQCWGPSIHGCPWGQQGQRAPSTDTSCVPGRTG